MQRAGSTVAHNLLRVQYGNKKADRAIDFLTRLKEVLSKDSLNKFTNLVSAYKQVILTRAQTIASHHRQPDWLAFVKQTLEVISFLFPQKEQGISHIF